MAARPACRISAGPYADNAAGRAARTATTDRGRAIGTSTACPHRSRSPCALGSDSRSTISPPDAEQLPSEQPAPPAPAAVAPPAPPAAAPPAATAAAPQPPSVLPAEAEMSTADRRQVQEALHRLDYYKGRVDGIFGPLTHAAIRRFQQSIGSDATGYLTADQANRLVTPR